MVCIETYPHKSRPHLFFRAGSFCAASCFFFLTINVFFSQSSFATSIYYYTSWTYCTSISFSSRVSFAIVQMRSDFLAWVTEANSAQILSPFERDSESPVEPSLIWQSLLDRDSSRMSSSYIAGLFLLSRWHGLFSRLQVNWIFARKDGDYKVTGVSMCQVRTIFYLIEYGRSPHESRL